LGFGISINVWCPAGTKQFHLFRPATVCVVNVAFLTHEPFYPPSGGGSAEAIYLVREMVQRGHEVHLFCPAFPEPEKVKRLFARERHAGRGEKSTPNPSLERNLEPMSSALHPALGGSSGGLQFHPFTSWQMGRYASLRNFKYLAYPFFLQRLVERAARHVRFDLVLSQHAVSAVAAGRLKQRLRLPVVMNFLDYLTGFMETWPRYLAPRGFIRALERFEVSLPLRHQANGVLTVSDTLSDYFAQTGYPRERILPIYYGYDAKLFRRDERSGGVERSQSCDVVMHGSFDQHHLGAIAAMALVYVSGRRPGARFKFVGQQTPSLMKLLKKVAAPQLQIECTGFVPYAEIARHLENASVGIVPYEESTGTHCAFVAKIVEYLGIGLPVVSTPLNSARRYFGNEPAVRFSEFSGESFGQQILDWLDSPLELRQGLGRAASQRVQIELDWGTISKKAIDFVEQIQQQQRRI
jgi:glycosyltransferase involved in cell wall biosynthesis